MPTKSATTRVFLCHASHDKVEVRRLARRLEALGFEVWLDEEGIRPGAHFRERIEAELGRATHLLAWVTEAWSQATWPREELDLFRRAFPSRPERVVAVLPTRADAQHLPAPLSTRNAVALEDCSTEEVDWLLYCAIVDREVGSRQRWEARAAQVRDEVSRVPDFSRAELLDAARRILSAPEAEGPLARNAALRCLAMGVSPVWVEEAVSPARCAAFYMRALAADVLPPERVWPRLAGLVEAGVALPEGLNEAELVRTVTTARQPRVVVSCLRILQRIGARKGSHQALTRWIDPDQDPEAKDPAAAHLIRGDATVLDAALSLLFAHRGAKPARFFRGYAAVLVGAADWWTVYLRHLLRLARAGRLPLAALAARWSEMVEASQDDPEQLIALCGIVDEVGELAIPLEVPLQELLHALRHRLREPWLSARQRVCELLVERHPGAVFLRLWPVLSHFGSWDDALPAARLTGLSAQEPAQVEELLTRVARTSAPEERVLLFEAVIGSPADLLDASAVFERVAAAAGRGDPLVHAAATLLDGQSLRTFQAALRSPEAATAFLETQPPVARALWPRMLAREYAAPDAGAEAWSGLAACARLAMRRLAEEAPPCQELDALRDATFDANLADLVIAWDQAVAVLTRLGSDLLEAAEKAQSQLRWLRSGLRLLPGHATAGLQGLDAALDAWLAAYPDIALTLAARPVPTLRFEVTRTPEWEALVALLQDQTVSDRLDQSIYPRLKKGSPSTRTTLMATMQRFVEADRARTLAHRICAVDEILGWLADKPDVPEREGLLWALLLRSHGHRCPGMPDRQLHRQLVGAVVQEYRDAPDALVASTRSLTLDIDSRLDIVFGYFRARPEAGGAWLLDELVTAAGEPGRDERVAEGLGLLASRPPSRATLPLLRGWVDTAGSLIAGAAATALRATSQEPEDVLRLLDLALRDPAAMVGVEGWEPD